MTNNRHPADELADVRAEIKRLEARESKLREVLCMPDADLIGDEYSAAVRAWRPRKPLGYEQAVARFGETIAEECCPRVDRIAVYLHQRTGRRTLPLCTSSLSPAKSTA
jgi:hypothetical protein